MTNGSIYQIWKHESGELYVVHCDEAGNVHEAYGPIRYFELNRDKSTWPFSDEDAEWITANRERFSLYEPESDREGIRPMKTESVWYEGAMGQPCKLPDLYTDEFVKVIKAHPEWTDTQVAYVALAAIFAVENLETLAEAVRFERCGGQRQMSFAAE